MASAQLVSVEKSLPKSVHEMSMNGDEPPSQYVVKGDSFESEDPSTLIPIPIVDVSLLSSEGELEKLRSALSSVGCFQAIGHGMSGSYLDKVREVAKQFFALPEEEKQKYVLGVNEFEGYGSERVVSEKQVRDWRYRLCLQVLPKRRLSVWPENPSDFSETIFDYSTKVKTMMDHLFRSMARSLNLEESSFLDHFGEQSLTHTWFNFYPRCSRPDMVFGVKPHTDGSGILVLLQDNEVEGLQVMVDDQWVKVPIIPDAFVVNLGDQMQECPLERFLRAPRIMSNGIFKSMLHRVVTNTEKLRMSVVVFNDADPEHEIGPLESLINETRPRLYRNVKNFPDFNYKCYQEGKLPIEEIKINQK